MKNVLLSVGVLLGVALVYALGHWRGVGLGASQAEEATRLIAADQLLLSQASQSAAEAQINQLEVDNREMQALIDSARKAARGAKPTSAISVTTAPLDLPASPTCLLDPTDKLVLHLDEVRLDTIAGNTIVAATLEARRARDDLLLARGPAKSVGAVALKVGQSNSSAHPGWLYGPALTWGSQGTKGIGGVVGLYPLEFSGVTIQPIGGFSLLTSGELLGSLGIMGAW